MQTTGEIQAKLVYYGAAESGKTANVQCIHRKLKRDHRGELRVEGVPPTAYEMLPVQLGQIRGFTTSIHVYAAPGSPEAAELRRKIVADADGVVFVADLRPDRYAATLESLKELQSNLRAHGRSLREILLVIQYNHRDEADENAVERLHRSIKLKPAASFEAVATDGTGVLPCLTTISKLILADLRKRADEEAAAHDEPEPASEPRATEKPAPAVPAPTRIEMQALTSLDDQKNFSVQSAGPAKAMGNEIELPIRLVHQRTGDEVELSIRFSIG